MPKKHMPHAGEAMEDFSSRLTQHVGSKGVGDNYNEAELETRFEKYAAKKEDKDSGSLRKKAKDGKGPPPNSELPGSDQNKQPEEDPQAGSADKDWAVSDSADLLRASAVEMSTASKDDMKEPKKSVGIDKTRPSGNPALDAKPRETVPGGASERREKSKAKAKGKAKAKAKNLNLSRNVDERKTKKQTYMEGKSSKAVDRKAVGDNESPTAVGMSESFKKIGEREARIVD